MSLSANFAGNRVVYAAARESSTGGGGNSGWQTIGVVSVPPVATTAPNGISVSPAAGSGLAQTFTFSYQGATSANDLQTVWGVLNSSLDGRNACYFAYYRPSNLLYLYPDSGDGTQAASMPLSGTGTLSNSQCSIAAQGAKATSVGTTLSLTLPITFTPAFTGNQAWWLAGMSMADAQGHVQISNWQPLGAWQVR